MASDMPPPKRNRPRRVLRQLYIGQWLRGLGLRQTDMAKETGINEGYISSLISGERDNPSAAILLQIADFMDVPVNYLYKPPPDRNVIIEAGSIDPLILARLREKTLDKK
jgi:transcriptional regulator with XRE-family HTH domain